MLGVHVRIGVFAVLSIDRPLLERRVFLHVDRTAVLCDLQAIGCLNIDTMVWNGNLLLGTNCISHSSNVRKNVVVLLVL